MADLPTDIYTPETPAHIKRLRALEAAHALRSLALVVENHDLHRELMKLSRMASRLYKGEA